MMVTYFKQCVILDASGKAKGSDILCADFQEGPWYVMHLLIDRQCPAVELSWNTMRYVHGQARTYPAVIGYNNALSEDIAEEIEDWFLYLETATNVDDVLEKSRKFIDGSLDHVQLLDVAYLRQRYAQKLYSLGCSNSVLAAIELVK